MRSATKRDQAAAAEALATVQTRATALEQEASRLEHRARELQQMRKDVEEMVVQVRGDGGGDVCVGG